MKDLKFYPLENSGHLDPLMEEIGDAKIVMLGEASHGTSEYYTWRTAITKRLIKEKGFSFISVEGDWPECYSINRYIKGYINAGASAAEVLRVFKRWPTWMWANWEVAALVDWLKEFNEPKADNKKVGFYGLDVYSLWESLHSILDYLEKNDGVAVNAAKKAFQCFEPFNQDPQQYAQSVAFTPDNCQEEVIGMLNELSSRKLSLQNETDREHEFNNLQNAIVAVNAEKYYRAMVMGRSNSWNVRDRHMMDTLDRLMELHGPGTKAIVWAHNTHIGDARATDMKNAGMFNIGQLGKEEYGADEVKLIGFGSYRGTVIAGDEWGAPMQKMIVPEARVSSWEYFLHDINTSNKLILSKDITNKNELASKIGHRAIGVVYNPDYERYGNYVATIVPERYDAFLFIDKTNALNPFHLHPEEKGNPDLFPWNF